MTKLNLNGNFLYFCKFDFFDLNSWKEKDKWKEKYHTDHAKIWFLIIAKTIDLFDLKKPHKHLASLPTYTDDQFLNLHSFFQVIASLYWN